MKLANYHFYQQLVDLIRDFFHQENFQEIITPILNSSLPSEANIYPFTTQWHQINREKTFFLSPSPESSLKKALASGVSNCFTIAHCFRNLENTSCLHRPEFLMLEWYRTRADYRQIMRDCQNLLIFLASHLKSEKTAIKQADCQTDWPVLSLDQLFQKYLAIDLRSLAEQKKIIKLANSKHYQTQGASWQTIFEQLFLNEILPHLSNKKLHSSIFFLTDYPSKISPLCQPRQDQSALAERFELFIKQVEIVNGNTELTDAQLVKQHFQQELQYRQNNKLASPPIDQDFLQALKILAEKNQTNGQQIAGAGLGIERLVMTFLGLTDIADLDFFKL